MIPTVDGIIRAVAQHRGFTPEDITGRARGILGKTTAARNMAFWLAREVAKGKLEEIAVEFDHRDHSSIVYGIREHERAMADNGHVRRLTEFLGERCRRDTQIRSMIRRRLTSKEGGEVLGIAERTARQEAQRIGLMWPSKSIAAERRCATEDGRRKMFANMHTGPKNKFEEYNLHLLNPRQLKDYRTLRAARYCRAEAAQAIGRPDILRPDELANINRKAA